MGRGDGAEAEDDAMIVHLALEFDLDTTTAKTSDVTQKVTMLEQKHLCRRPGCGKEAPLDKVYCCRDCFTTHGTRTRTKNIATGAPVLVAPSLAQPLDAVVVPPPLAIPDYRSFTFPQGGLS